MLPLYYNYCIMKWCGLPVLDGPLILEGVTSYQSLAPVEQQIARMILVA